MIEHRSGFPERIVPDETEPGIVALHLKRYDFALAACRGMDVLDAGCGVGYGVDHLATVARHVVGVDIDPEAIAYARRRYGSSTAEFHVMDLDRLEWPEGSFDVICSFETIEHVESPERMLAEVARVLRPAGRAFLSTPHAPRTTRHPANPHHRVEFSREDFERLLRGFFAEVEIYGQRRRQTRAHRVAQRLDVLGLRRRIRPLRRGARVLGTAPMADLTLDDVVIDQAVLSGATELVAVCRKT